VETYKVPPKSGNPFEWDKTSEVAIEAIRKHVTDQAWWEALAKAFAQENKRDYPGAENLNRKGRYCPATLS
jgi:hypothetical protein